MVRASSAYQRPVSFQARVWPDALAVPQVKPGGRSFARIHISLFRKGLSDPLAVALGGLERHLEIADRVDIATFAGPIAVLAPLR